jgi:hypothetical protein
MKIYDLAVVEDHGSFWKVNNLVQNTMDNLADKSEKMLKLSYMSHEIMKDAILAGKVIHIPKASLRSVEVLPGDFNIIEPEKENELDATKNAVIVKVRMLITPILTKISGFTLYGFMVLNNDLANAGYFITNENREEKYLDILEKGDEKLIAKLEDYLNYKDEIENVAFIERQFAEFRNELKNLNSIEKVQQLEYQFLEKLQDSLK